MKWVNFLYVNWPRLKLISSGMGGVLEMHDNPTTGLGGYLLKKSVVSGFLK